MRLSKGISNCTRLFKVSCVLLILAVSGCKTQTVYVPVETVKTEYKDKLRVDSIYYRDTVEIKQVNDTVFLTSKKWRERFKTDTVSVVKKDSIPYPVEVVKEVNRLTRWQRLRLNALNVLVALLLLFVATKIKTR